MRVGVIRGDLPGPVFIADLEQTSQPTPTTAPPGQTRYISRPDATRIAAYLTAQGLAASASTIITTCLPVGGPLDVSSATITGIAGLGAATAAQVKGIADLIAPQIAETSIARNSFLKGNLKGLLSASYNPDPSRTPALSNGAAITVVTDDGVTLYT